LVGNPSVILMDEPSEGLAPVIVEELARALKRLSAMSLTLIVVEQNSRLALDLSPRAIVMDRGRIVYDGDSATLQNDPEQLHRLIGVGKR
jgi:branched-chain amino acid transport system ATP-binding protein